MVCAMCVCVCVCVCACARYVCVCISVCVCVCVTVLLYLIDFKSHCKVTDTISFVVMADSGILSSCLQLPRDVKDALLILLTLGTK